MTAHREFARDSDAGNDMPPRTAAGHHEHAFIHQPAFSLTFSRIPSEARVASSELPP